MAVSPERIKELTKFDYNSAERVKNLTEEEIKAIPKLHTFEDGVWKTSWPITFNTQKPDDPDNPGKLRDQTNDAAAHMRYAGTLNLPKLQLKTARMGRAVICGGGPSIEHHIEDIRKLADDPVNKIFALNSTHTILLNYGIVPDACVFFEIDAEPDAILKNAHESCTYYICSHCHEHTFDALEGFPRVLWHSLPNSEGERVVSNELYPDDVQIGGGIGTILRTLSVALTLGYRNIDLFGCDSSFPDDSASTHVDGYETVNNVKTDSFYIYAKPEGKQEVKKFKTVGYLALQVEEFKEYCLQNHQHFGLRVHGDSLLRYVHERTYPDQYVDE